MPPSHSKPYPATGAVDSQTLCVSPSRPKRRENVFWRRKTAQPDFHDTLRTPGASRFDTLKGCESDFFGILHFTFYYQCVIYVSKAARMCRQSFAGKR